MYDIPRNATIRLEYVKCGNPDCAEKHGPYNYAYWKDRETKKLKKRYIGKSWEDYLDRTMAKSSGNRPMHNENRKLRFIQREVESGNNQQLAKEHMEKFYANKVSLDWASKKIRKKIIDTRLQKLADRMDADDISKGKAIELDNKKRLEIAVFTANIMIGIGLDYTNGEDINRFLNCKPGDPVFESLKLPKL
jgi:hypothetical protein